MRVAFLLIKHFFVKKVQFRKRHFWKNMDYNGLRPPSDVRGMTVLNRDAFHKVIIVPKLKVEEKISHKVISLLKQLLLKMECFKPVCNLVVNDVVTNLKEINLHPLPVRNWESLPTDSLEKLGIDRSSFYFGPLELTYKNWRADEILKSVLPEHEEGLTSFSRVGHIVHINLREHLLSYKQLIGEVIRDKVVGCRTVVNKPSTIDNTYRNFHLELVCGEEQYKVEVKENGIVFEFDFAKVYWNPRLSTEHERIVKLLNPGDLLYDVFAGVGPFSIPASKKGCRVLANDLNPDSFKWLNVNIKRNKCSQMQTFNKDGRAFITENIKEDLLKTWSLGTNGKIHITMNLPAMAPEFLDAFCGLFQSIPHEQKQLNYPLLHLYLFAKGENTKELGREIVEKSLGLPLEGNLEGIYFVRNVAPNKDMYRISFYLTEEILTTPKNKNNLKRAAIQDSMENDTIVTKQKILH